QLVRTPTAAAALISSDTGWLLLSRWAMSHTEGTPRRPSRFTPSLRANGSRRVPYRPNHHPDTETATTSAIPTARPLSVAAPPRTVPSAATVAAARSTSPAIGVPHIPGNAE